MNFALYRTVKDFAKRRLCRPAFEVLQRVGLNVTPVHFYSEIPNVAELRATNSWRRAYDLSALRMRPYSEQLDLVRGWVHPYLSRAVEAGVLERAEASQASGGFGPVEGYILYAFIAAQRPRRVLQVGCGVSTSIIIQAQEQQRTGLEGASHLLCIEPYPSEYLRELDRHGRIDLVEERAQDWDHTSALRDLGCGDFLFVDSTHTTVPGSEVNRIILEWLPSLAAGVWVHFHDIYLPYDYAPGILTQNLFFTRESLLLQAFLSCNRMLRVEVSLSLLHHERQQELVSLLGDVYRPRTMRFGLELDDKGHFPSSTYLRSVEPELEDGHW